MGDASSLHCPNCGAAVDPDARRCPYCQARLATVSCPSCFALMFDTAAFCPKCGSRRARATGDRTGARCPGCAKELQQVDVGSTTLMECAACDGVWMAAETFERLCTDRESQAAVLHRFPGSKPAGGERVRYRPCVRCGKMMNRVNFGQMSGTVVDVCRGHGTYLDSGELHQIVAFIHSGGLDRARERKLEDMREQERRLNALGARTSRDRGAANPHASLGFTAGSWSAEPLLQLINLIRGSKRE
jgi:Zn-finger nucleic acid-binding protein/RNA polymerase subunit RPABC4/transcription elongation factor Spt4